MVDDATKLATNPDLASILVVSLLIVQQVKVSLVVFFVILLAESLVKGTFHYLLA